MTGHNALPTGYVSQEEIMAARRRLAERNAQPQTQAPTQTAAPTEYVTEYSSRRHMHPAIALSAGLLIAAGTVYTFGGFDQGTKATASIKPAEQSPAATDPAVEPITSPTEVAEPTTDAVETPAPAAVTTFASSVIGCVPAASVAVSGEAGIKWIGVYQKNGAMFATQPNSFAGVVSGNIASNVCLNADTVTFDQALTDQNGGVQTYTYDMTGMRFTADATGVQNGVRTYEKADIWESLKQDYKQARKLDARRLANNVQKKTDAVSRINRYFMYANLASDPNRAALVEAGRLAIENAYKTMATSQGIAAESIIFAPLNAPAAEAMTFNKYAYPELNGKCKNPQKGEPKYTCYLYQPDIATWQFQINPATGVTP